MFLSTGFQVSGITGVDLRLWYVPFLIASGIIILYRKQRKSKCINFLFLCLLFSSFVSIIFSDFIYERFINSFIQISIAYIFLLLIYSMISFLDTKKIIQAYLVSSLVFAISVIFHEMLYIVNSEVALKLFGPAEVSGILLKATGLLGEPSWGGVLLAPSIYITLVLKQRTKFLVLFLGAIFTLSALTYISLVLSLILYFYFVGKNSLVLKVGGGLIIILIGYGLVNQGTISNRLEQAEVGLQIITDDTSIDQYLMASGTVATLVFNAKVAYESITSTYGLGVGLGNFKYMYNDIFEIIIPVGYSGEGLFYSRIGGGSLWIRIITELGIIGFVLLFIIHVKLYLYYGELLRLRKIHVINTDQLVLYTLGLIIFIVYCIRKDAWINHVFLFSIALLLISANYKKIIKNA